jgi:hypothetical protein
MKSTGARRLARSTLGATRPWIAAGCATAQWKARFARRYPPPTPALAGDPNPSSLDQPLQAKHHHIDPRKQIPGGRHQIGIPGGFNSESVAGFLSECLAGFLGIRTAARRASVRPHKPLPLVLFCSRLVATVSQQNRRLQANRREHRGMVTYGYPNTNCARPNVNELPRTDIQGLAAPFPSDQTGRPFAHPACVGARANGMPVR